ncbi:two-component system, chemotaxis family, CheB/CheR fusion protein [Arachidicoccus rhizosphaerae]|uniref:Two-component system, chemotaxis family, CheB/CheR fusion protein n=1 Tax=Arachidicoccus rhizosphaerae TaxID=551991 RepID=A0A1H3YZI7_9BACT|nr:chemotaxis protein CheB [Arachidicoccus rhizosphaerae]SEA16502.1 two-component system, chemotaxis family, CheB/CheR fusion protein [Arachidicoccus rhizosphaerae]
MAPFDPQNPPEKQLSANKFLVIGIGASAGGLDAFKKIVSSIDPESGMAFILVQHLQPEHESILPDILEKFSKIPVVAIKDNMKVEPDHIYIIPSDKLLIATDGVLKLGKRPTYTRQNRAIDVFFTSLAEVHRGEAIGVLLSGKDEDGTQGLHAIKAQGGLTIAQDLESAQFPRMPESAIQAEVVDLVLPPEDIFRQLLLIKRALEDTGGKQKLDNILEENLFEQIYGLLLLRRDVDFTFYKQTTVRRRIVRRMGHLKLETINQYLHYLKENKEEQDVLFQDMLIPVTEFFRDPNTFDFLRESIYPFLLEHKASVDPLRIWIVGCSTGQEVYSMAISLFEFLGEDIQQYKVQIFATDISEKAITKAKSGQYNKKELKGISSQRQSQFFTESDGKFLIDKRIRNLCIFAVHNFLKDPPFARMDIISCRNVLIYMNNFLQQKAFTIFHYALSEKGFLILGRSETTLNASDLFFVYDKKNKIYSKKRKPENPPKLSGKTHTPLLKHRTPAKTHLGKNEDFQRNADSVLLSKYTPPALIVNDHFDIVQFRGATSRFLQPSPGKASLNVLKMILEGLAFELRSALHKVKKSHEPFEKPDIPLGGGRLVTLEVIPLLNTIEPYFLILFMERKQSLIIDDGKANLDNKSKRILQLEKELSRLREDIHAISEDQEALTEELQSANEELLSDSEELQSLNEELETSAEELQSANEELLTVNHELSERNEQLNEYRQLTESIIDTLHESFLILNDNFQVKSVNAAFLKHFHCLQNEVLGKSIFDIQGKGWNIPGLKESLMKVSQKEVSSIDLEVSFVFPVLGPRDICFNIQPIEQAAEPLFLVAIDDLTDRKLNERNLILARERQTYYDFFMQTPAAICILKGRTFTFEFANPAFIQLIGGRDPYGMALKDALSELEDKYLQIFETVYNTKTPYVGKEIPVILKNDQGKLERKCLNITCQIFGDIDGQPEGVMVFAYDITDLVRAQMQIRENESNLLRILEALPVMTWTNLNDGTITFYNRKWYRYTGVNFDEQKWSGWKSIIHPEDYKDTLRAFKKALENGAPFEVENRYKGTDGQYRWHLNRAIPIFLDDQIHMWVGTATDINEQKISEQKKDEFLSIASHEMKTPLTTAIAYIQLIEQNLSEASGPNRIYATKALMSMNRLTDLIAELLDVSKIQHGKLPYRIKDIDFNDLVESAIESIHYVAPDYHIIKEGRLTQHLNGDKDRLTQVMINLLSNAVKYSPHQKEIKVVIKQESERVIVSVTDQGIGICKDHLKKIFDRYYRVNQQDAIQFQGLGIGLYITSEIIKRHGGKLWVESIYGQGSTFYFSLPLKGASKGVLK